MESLLPGKVCRPRQDGKGREKPRAWWSGPLGFLTLPGLLTITIVLGMVPWHRCGGEGEKDTRGPHPFRNVL